MGRSTLIDDCSAFVRLHLYRMRLVDGDYDNGGAYWGGGNAVVGWMYHAYDVFPAPTTQLFVRARSREEAKQLVRHAVKNASFFR